MARSSRPTRSPRETIACTRIRATPYDLVILWSHDNLSDEDMDALQVIAEGLAETTGSRLAVIPETILTDASSHGLVSLVNLRDELDEVIQRMSTEQSAGEC